MSDSFEFSGSQVLLVAPVALSDACLAAPALRSIPNARPDLAVVLACPTSAAPLWAPFFDQILTYDPSASVQKIADQLQDSPFSSAILLEDSKAAKAVAKLQVPQRVGPNLPGLEKSLTKKISLVEPLGPLRHRVTRFLDFAEALDCEPRKSENFTTLGCRTSSNEIRVGFAPDSDFGPAAQWPAPSFEKVAELLAADYALTFVPLSLSGVGAAATALTDSLELGKEEHKGDLEALLETLRGLTILIASDGTLPNLAAHIGLPTITLMGPRAKDIHRPLGKIHIPLTTYAECSPCNLPKCPLDHRCLEELAPESVVAAARDLLEDAKADTGE